MGTCCCSMAGTRACDTCTNGPSQKEIGYAFPNYYKPAETIEEAIERILREKGIEGTNTI